MYYGKYKKFFKEDLPKDPNPKESSKDFSSDFEVNTSPPRNYYDPPTPCISWSLFVRWSSS